MRALRRIALWLGGILALLVVLAAGAVGWLQTGAGKSWLAATLSDVASDASGFAIRIGAIDGTVPSDMSIASLEIADAQGTWLTASDVELAWRPLDLVTGLLSIERVAAERIEVLRAPVAAPADATPTPPAAPPLSFELPSLPVEIAVANLEVAEIRLGDSLLGEAALVALFGSARLGGAPRDAELALNLLRLDGVPARVEILLSQSPGSGDRAASLTLQADIAEPAGGLVAGLLDLPGRPAVALHLSGSGPADDWTGRLTASAGDASADLQLNLALAERIDLAVAGEIDPGGLAGAAIADMLPRPLAVDAAVGVVPGERIEIAHADVSAPGIDAHVEGTLDQRAQTIAATARLAAHDPALLARLADPAGAAGLRATARLSGALAAPLIDLDATLDGVAAPGVAAAAIDLAATVAPTADGGALDLAVRVDPRGLVLEAGAVLAPLIGETPSLALDGRLDLATLRLDIAALALDGAALGARGQGHVAAEGRDLDLTLALHVADLAPVGALAGQDMRGALDAALTVTGDATAPRLDVTVDATGEGVALADPLLNALVGAAPRLAAGLTMQGETVTLARSELTTALATAQAAGGIGDSLDLSVDLTAASLAPLSRPLGVNLAGGLAVAARVTGAAADPALQATATGSAMSVAGLALGDPRLELAAEGLAEAPRGQAKLTAAPGRAPLTASTGFQLAGDGGLALEGIAVDGAGGARVSGDLRIGANGLVDGALEGEVADLSPWQDVAGMPLAGAIGLRLTAEASAGAQAFGVGARARDLALAAVTLTELTLQAAVQDALGNPAVDAEATATGVGTDGIAFDTVRLGAQGPLSDLGWTVVAASDGEDGGDALDGNVDAAGRLALTDGGGTATLASLAARLSDVELDLARPATLAWGDGGFRVDEVEATLGGGRIAASGAFADAGMTLDATVSDLPVGPLAELSGSGGVDGRLSGRAALSGDPAAPQGDVTLRLDDLRESGVDPAEAITLSGEADATLGGGRIEATARLFGPTDLGLDARLSAPLAGDGPLSGAVSGGLDLALVPRVVDLRGDALSGRLDVDLALSGSRAAPVASGRATIAGGAYESATQGTVLREITAEVVGDNDRVRLASFSATDGDRGRLSGSGTMAIDPDAGFPIDASVTLNSFTALRRPDATVMLSGEVAVARSATGGEVAGRLTVDGAELRIPDRLGGEVVTLEVTEVNLPPGQAPIEPPPPDDSTPLALDVAIDIPGQAFLRGRGLDSEWRGRLQVGGTTAAPDIVGDLNVVRGTLDLLGRNFRFDEGQVRFIGGDEIDPELDFAAQSEAESLTVEVDGSGTASAPSFSLSSEPALPEDEILARLLFGSSAGSLTPVQAVQLAQTAATLSGRGSSVSVLDNLRQGFGLDMLGVESGETLSSSSLAVGKYLTDDVFVKMNQGATPESRKLGVEVRVLPQVTVESDIGAESQGSVGVNWKLDY